MSRTDETPTAPAPGNGRDGWLELNGLRFHYVSWGQPQSPALVCLHGLRSYARTFAPLAATLSRSFFVIALDQRGRGETDWDPDRNYYADQYVSDLATFVDRLGLARFHLLGHSMGGVNSILYAASHPGRLLSLILEDSGPGASQNSRGASRINAELANTPASFPDWESARAFWRSIRPNVTDAAIDSRVANSLKQGADRVEWRHDQAGIALCRLTGDPTRTMPDLWPLIPQITCPALVIRGAESDYLSTETLTAMQAANPRLRGIEVAGAGHYVHDDQPAAFHRAVISFLAGQAAAS